LAFLAKLESQGCRDMRLDIRIDVVWKRRVDIARRLRVVALFVEEVVADDPRNFLSKD